MADGITKERLAELRKRLAEVEAENFALAAHQCLDPVSGEHGHALCGAQERLRAQLVQVEAERDRLVRKARCAEDAIRTLPSKARSVVYAACYESPGPCWCGVHRSQLDAGPAGGEEQTRVCPCDIHVHDDSCKSCRDEPPCPLRCECRCHCPAEGDD